MMYYGMGLGCHHRKLYCELRVGCMSFKTGISLRLKGLPGQFRNGGNPRRGGSNATLMGLGVKVAYAPAEGDGL